MSNTWDDCASTWDHDERVRFYADQAFLSLSTHVNIQSEKWKSSRVLDFGCGTGLLGEKLAPLVDEIFAVDISQNMIEVLRRKEIGNVTAVCADIDDPAVRSSAPWFREFDLIVASSVCGFLPNYETTVAALSQAMKDAGYFVQWDWLSSGDDDFGMTVKRIAGAFEGANLTCVYAGTAFSVSFDGEDMPVVMGVARR